jgi:drug/metabolite transporter (DMT)-like permease
LAALKISELLAFFAIYIIWGSTYLAIRHAVETIPPLMTAGIRHLIAGLIIYAWARREPFWIALLMPPAQGSRVSWRIAVGLAQGCSVSRFSCRGTCSPPGRPRCGGPQRF